MKKKAIRITGARVHNLKNVDVEIPHGSLTVFTGLSGSGKSSLAFDTLYAEGQRRYIETFSAYARGFLENLERPDVDRITGLSPVISIEQKTTNRNPRSTVGTVTEIYDYLRLLYARAADAYSYLTGERMVKYTEEAIVRRILDDYQGEKIILLAPLVRARKGHYRELFETVRRRGFLTARVDGELREITPGMKLDRYRQHDIEVVVDRLAVKPADEERLTRSVREALHQGGGLLAVMRWTKDASPKQFSFSSFQTSDSSLPDATESLPADAATPSNASRTAPNPDFRFFSRHLMCPTTGLSYRDPAPHCFSFNSVHGACPKCKGLGTISDIDREKVIPNAALSVKEGGLAPLGKARDGLVFWEIEVILARYGCNLTTPLDEVPEEAIDEILYGSPERLRVAAARAHTTDDLFLEYQGLGRYLQRTADADGSAAATRWAEQFSTLRTCPACQGKRLNREALSYRLAGKDISQLADMDLRTLSAFLTSAPTLLDNRQQRIAQEVIKEIQSRLQFLLDVGLDYLSLSRSTVSLSGGESQRIRLATQIGSRLVGVLYILDEPSIGLHQRDNLRLIRSLKSLRDAGNTVLVVEHDEDMMRAADYIVDFGPRAGREGGRVVFAGTYPQLLQADTLTALYLTHRRSTQPEAAAQSEPLKPIHADTQWLRLKGCRGNNLKNLDVAFPLGQLVGVTGVSGSGKSTLVNETLLPILMQRFYRALTEPLPYDSIEGIEHIDKAVAVDQSPIGRTPRSNPATYTGVFNDIRTLFVSLPEAQIRGYKPGRFSFNVRGGRCETCKGNGYKTIEMNFLPDVLVPCEACQGKRYNRETLEVRYKGKSIADILDMTIDEAVDFFAAVPNILQKVKTLQDVGLGYIRLGQSSTTLSGGESQRVKLAAELAKRDTGHTLFVLDEPTTGLHFEDIRQLLRVLRRLVDKGNTVIVIEHNLDVIRACDYLIDLGPEGGNAGGTLVCAGTPDEIRRAAKGYTAQYL